MRVFLLFCVNYESEYIIVGHNFILNKKRDQSLSIKIFTAFYKNRSHLIKLYVNVLFRQKILNYTINLKLYKLPM